VGGLAVLKRYSANCHEVTKSIKYGETWHTLQISDVHFDSPKCDRILLTKHLKEAETLGAFVVINGDLLDVMGAKKDPRSNYSGIRPEYKVDQYLDSVIEDCIEYLAKFKLSYLINRGNHETNILKRMHTDPTERIVQGLKGKGVNCDSGGYSGWIRWKFDGASRLSKLQHYHHGYGGNAPRSKGVLGIDIDMKKFPDADIITRGHDHNKWYVPQRVQRISNKMAVSIEEVHNLRTGSYKELGDGFGGWAIEKGFDHPSLGGWWVSFKHHQQNRVHRMDIQVREAR